MKRLKDKVWRECNINIERLVEQTVDGATTQNKVVAYLVTLRRGEWTTMFQADSRKELWAKLIELSMIPPTDAEQERMHAKLRKRRKPQTPLWRQVLDGEPA